METPRITTRTPSQAPVPSKVRENYLRNQFSPADSGLGGYPSIHSPFDNQAENSPEVRHRREIGQFSPISKRKKAIHRRNILTEDGLGENGRTI